MSERREDLALALVCLFVMLGFWTGWLMTGDRLCLILAHCAAFLCGCFYSAGVRSD